MDWCDAILFIFDGRVPDEGACFELGYCYAKGKKCIGYKTDARSFIDGYDKCFAVHQRLCSAMSKNSKTISMHKKENKNMKNEKVTVSRLFACLMGVYITCLLLSNLIAGKMMAIGNVTLPAAVILFPITYILCDVFTEIYGYKNMRTVIWMGFGCSAFAVIIYMITIALPHPDFWGNQEAFATVLGTTPRVFAASLIGYLFGEFSNSMILSKLKVKTQGKNLWLRTIGSTIVGEAFDTVIFLLGDHANFYTTPDDAVPVFV